MQQSQQRKCCQWPSANRWRPLTAFPLKILDNVSSTGNGAGIAASSRKGSASKGTNVSNLYNYLNRLFLTIQGIFGSPRLYYTLHFYIFLRIEFFNNSGNFWVPPSVITFMFCGIQHVVFFTIQLQSFVGQSVAKQ